MVKANSVRVLIAIALIIAVLDGVVVRLFLGSPHSAYYYGYFVLPPILMFISSALLGDLIEKRLHPGRLQTGFAEKLAMKFAVKRKASRSRATESKSQYEERVKRIAGFISALAPILGLIGTIISAFFTYLAATKK